MDNEFIMNLKEISVQAVVIGVLVFVLTMLIKWPIKKCTAKLKENKRKAINTVIVFIPMCLSFLLSMLYLGIFEKQWVTITTLDLMTTSYLLALSIYAVFSRIVILIKGGIKSDSKEKEELSKQTISYIKQNIKAISKTLKVDEKSLSKVVSEIDKLLVVRDEIQNNCNLQDLAQAENIQTQLYVLKSEKERLSQTISDKKLEVENFKSTLNK